MFEGRIETVSAGLPTGTIHTASASITFSDATGGSAWYKKTLGVACAVAKDDLLAPVIQYSSGTISGANQIFLLRNANNGGGINACLLPCALSHNGTSWSQTQLPPNIAIYYDDGSIVGGGFYAYAITAIAYQSGSSPNEYSNSFVAPAGQDCIGIDAWLGFGNTSASAIATLYDSSNNVLATRTIPGSIGANFGKVFFEWAAVSLTAGATYSLGIKSGSANNLTIYRYDFNSTIERNASVGIFTGRSRAGGSWTDTALSTYSLSGRFSATTGGSGYGRSESQ